MAHYADSIAKPPRTLTDREQVLLLKVTGEHRAGFRDHVIYAMALATGLREHEIAGLDVVDVFDANGRARRRLRLRVFKRSNDDPAMQEVLLPETLRLKLEKLYRLTYRGGPPPGGVAPVFVSGKGGRLSCRQMRHAFRQWQGRAGFDRPFNFHALRHTACTSLFRQTKDIRLTQRFARHKSILSTTCYTHGSDEDLLRAVQALRC